MKRRREDQDEAVVEEDTSQVEEEEIVPIANDINTLRALFFLTAEEDLSLDYHASILDLCTFLDLRPFEIKQDTEYVHAEVRRGFIHHILSHEWTPQIWLFLSTHDLRGFCFPEALDSSDYWQFWFECSLTRWPHKLKDIRKIARGIDARTFLHRIHFFARETLQETSWETFSLKARENDPQSQMLRAICEIAEWGLCDTNGQIRDEALLLINDYHFSNYEMEEFFHVGPVPDRKIGMKKERQLQNGMNVYISLSHVSKRIFAVRKNLEKERSLLVYSRMNQHLDDRWIVCHCVDGTQQTIHFATRFAACRHFGSDVAIGIYPGSDIIYIACFQCNRYLFLDAMDGTWLSLLEVVSFSPAPREKMPSFQHAIHIFRNGAQFCVVRLYKDVRDNNGKKYYMLQQHKDGAYIDVSSYREVLDTMDYDKHLEIAAFFDNQLDDNQRAALHLCQVIITPNRKYLVLVQQAFFVNVQKPCVLAPNRVRDKSELQGVFDDNVAVWFVKERGLVIWQDLEMGTETTVPIYNTSGMNCHVTYIDPWTLDLYFIEFSGKAYVVHRPSRCEWSDDATYRSACEMLLVMLSFLRPELTNIIQHYLYQMPRFGYLEHVSHEHATHSPKFVTPTMMCI